MLMFVLDGTSRMTGDCHVRFCERLRGETPLCLLGDFLANFACAAKLKKSN